MRNYLVLFFCFLVTLPLQAKTWRINTADQYQLRSIFESLKPGDKVVLDRGRYELSKGIVLENLQNVEIRGEGRVEIVLDSLYDPVFEIKSCERIQIRNVRARHKEPLDQYECEGAVIKVRNSNKVGVFDSELNGCGSAGVYALDTENLVIKGNRIFNNTYSGVWLYNSSGFILDNEIYNNAAGILTMGKTRLTTLRNEIHDNYGNSYSGAESVENMFR